MLKRLALLLLIFYCQTGKTQTLQLVPRVGFQYHGLSFISDKDAHPSDFRGSVPEFEGTFSIDIKYQGKHLAHLVSLQSIALGPSFSFTNQYRDKGIVPTYTGHHTASSIDQAILTYGVEKGSRRNVNFIGTGLRFNYSVSGGVGFNKSREAYDSILPPDEYGMQIGDSYQYYKIIYSRSGIGAYLSVKGGVDFYNKKNKCFLSLQAFWHQGLRKMAEYSIHYQYGYFSHPEYQRDQYVLLKSRGTVFGMTAGVPIRILQ